MAYKENDIITGFVNNIKENGVYIEFDESPGFGFLPKSEMTDGITDGVITLKRWKPITVAFKKISNRGIIFSQSLVNEIQKKQQHNSLIEDFNLQHQKGQVFEAEVTKIETDHVQINVNGVNGVITKEELNYNVIESPSDVVFEGEILRVMYLGMDDDMLQFSTKRLNPKPYEEHLYDLNLERVLQLCNVKSSLFVGCAKKYGSLTFIENLYSLGSNKGTLLIDPFYGYNLRALVPNNKYDVQNGKFYQVKIDLVSKDKRKERNQLFQFVVKTIQECENPYKDDVNRTYKKLTDPAANIALEKTIEEIEKNNNITKDRMFFELIQNADDSSAQKGVSIYITTTDNYLVFCHNGYSFSKDDFEAITSSANGTKKTNENKTGYKGIGFKSVFKDSENVIIKTGLYQFKFDRSNPLYYDFVKYYSFVNGLQTKEQIDLFCERFEYEYRIFDGVNSIPWQLKPIWLEALPDELVSVCNHHNVSIALKIKPNSIDGIKGYKDVIKSVLENPKFMLFLRNTNRITMSGMAIRREFEGDKIVLKNSFGVERVEKFERYDFDIIINDQTFVNQEVNIRLVEKRDEKTGDILESRFVNLNNQEIEEIPPKIAYSRTTTISFAVPVTEKGIEPDKKCKSISMFAYLPTIVKDFRFPFFINANFLLDSPRQHLLGDNPWNLFLMHELGEKVVEWCAYLCSKKERNSLNVLITKLFDETSSADTNNLAQSFNVAYKKSLESVPFILNTLGKLAKQNDIIIDKTGLSDIIGEELFCDLLETEKKFPSSDIDASILSNTIFEQVEIIKIDELISHLGECEKLNDWYISANDSSKNQLINWLDENKDKCETIIKSLPIIKFGDEYKSYNFLSKQSFYIITNETLNPIKPILKKIGIICSDDVIDENNLLYTYLSPLSDKSLFDLINNQYCHFIDCESALWEYDNCGAYEGQEISIAHLFIKYNLFSQDRLNYLQECQKSVEEESEEFHDYVYDHYTTYDIPNECRMQIEESSLSKEEKVALAKTIKEFKIDDSVKKSLIIFRNTENKYAAIGNMLPYKDGSPKWIEPYMINPEEYSEELDELLIDNKEEFIWDNMVERKLNVSVNEVYSSYPWSDENYTRRMINLSKSDEELSSLIDIVEISGDKTKKLFLEKIKRINLDKEQKYKKESWEYRVLQLVLSVYEHPSDYSSKIFFEECCIKDFTIKDEVICEYSQDDGKKKVKMSLAKLLPYYHDQSDSIEKVKNLFEKKEGLDKLFNATAKPLPNIHSELNTYLNIPERNFSEWNVKGNAYQYLFAVYYRRYWKGWNNLFVPKINLGREDDSFINELMDFLCDNDIVILSSPFTYHISSSIVGKCFSSDYILDEEAILSCIEKWADSEGKKNYLLRNGVCGPTDMVISFRQHFLNNEPYNEINTFLADSFGIDKALKFLSLKDSLCRPFIGDNQKEVLKKISAVSKKLSIETDVQLLEKNSVEYDEEAYNSWQKGSDKPCIFLYEGEMPRYYTYLRVRLVDFPEGNYFYSPTLKRLYINSKIERQEILTQLVGDSSVPFNSDDFFELFLKGKQAVSKDEWDSLKTTQINLEQDNKRLEEENRRLEDEVKTLRDLLNERSNSEKVSVTRSDGSSISKEKKIDAQIEAQRKLFEMYPNWTYPKGFGEGTVYSTFEIIDENGNHISIVLKSYKKQDVQFHLNPEEWDYLIDGAKLFVYKGDDICELDPKDLIMDQPSISLSFSTENFEVEDRVKALSDALHYFKQITFDFSSFNISEKAESIKGMYNKNEGKQNSFTDDDY